MICKVNGTLEGKYVRSLEKLNGYESLAKYGTQSEICEGRPQL